MGCDNITAEGFHSLQYTMECGSNAIYYNTQYITLDVPSDCTNDGDLNPGQGSSGNSLTNPGAGKMTSIILGRYYFIIRHVSRENRP